MIIRASRAYLPLCGLQELHWVVGDAILEHKLDVSRCFDVVEGVATHHVKICELAGLYRAKAGIYAQRSCAVDGGILQYGSCRYTRIGHGEQFAVIGEAW